MSHKPTFSLLKHKIDIFQNTSASELEGERWSLKYQTFAEIKPLFDHKIGSIENFDFGHIVTEGYFLFRIRYLEGLTVAMRINFKNRHFEIKRVIDPTEESKILQIIALEV